MVVWCELPKPCPMDLPAAIHLTSPLGGLCSLPEDFLGKCSMFQVSPLYCHLHPYAYIHHPLRGCLQGIQPSTHCLDSQAFLWNLGRSLHDLATLAFCMPAKPASCGGCQGLLPCLAINCSHLDHDCSSLWGSGWLSAYVALCKQVPQCYLLKAKSFKGV
jgi:hypothetical protein